VTMSRLRPAIDLCLATLCLLVVAAGSAGAATFSCLNLDLLGSGGALQGLMARPGGIDNALWNPSGLAGLETSRGVGFAGYTDYLAGTRGATAGYAWSARPGRGFGAYVSYLSAGTIPLSTWSDPVGGDQSFSYGEVVAGFSGGGGIGRHLRVGAGLKVDRENLDDVAAAGAFLDLSASVRLAGSSVTSRGLEAYLCAAARNITLGKWGPGAEAAPVNTEFGLAAVLPPGVCAGASFLACGEGKREMRVGLATLLSGEFEARLGWRRRIGTGSDSAYGLPWQRGLTAGFGVGLGKFWVDYTYEDASPLDGIHRFGLRAGTRGY
jgi:hypothetical protein